MKGPSPVPGAAGSKAGSTTGVAVAVSQLPKKASLEETNKGHATQLLGLIKEIEDWKVKVIIFTMRLMVAC